MPSDDYDVTVAAANTALGYVVAAAGCGKTEQIARATGMSTGRRLILTHTNAGVDVLRSRLNKLRVPEEKYRLDTIAGWSLRFAQAFPNSSGLVPCDRRHTDWNLVYSAVKLLIDSGAANAVIEASYTGLFVDEYQDCTDSQHAVVTSLSNHLPTCIFGDPLQAIFDFDKQQLVNWDVDIFPKFTQVGELKTAHRWRNAGTQHIAEWLESIREHAEKGRFAFDHLPRNIVFEALPQVVAERAQAILAACKRSHGDAKNERLMVIADPVNINARTAIAGKLARLGFSNIEPVGCAPLYSFAEKIDAATGIARMNHVLDFANRCINGLNRTQLDRAIESHMKGGNLGRAKYGAILELAAAVSASDDDKAISRLLAALSDVSGVNVYCRERYSSFRRAFETKQRLGLPTLADAVWEVQNRDRHMDRRLGNRAVGSTLLVKGLECEYGVVVHANNMSATDWYVALTRATKGLRILAPSPKLQF
jgi:DNA helicase-2/ATP-dependent DNA helicase PcrA